MEVSVEVKSTDLMPGCQITDIDNNILTVENVSNSFNMISCNQLYRFENKQFFGIPFKAEYCNLFNNFQIDYYVMSENKKYERIYFTIDDYTVSISKRIEETLSGKKFKCNIYDRQLDEHIFNFTYVHELQIFINLVIGKTIQFNIK